MNDASEGHEPEGLDPERLLKAGLDEDGRPEIEELAEHFPDLELIERIGEGGMGVVYRARQKKLDRIVAVKVLPPREGESTQFAERFTREARALARLEHGNIVRVYEFGEADGLYYLVLEFVDGLNLRELSRERAIEPAEALAIVPQICSALQYAHDRGVVHRDIKPENILVGRDGSVKITDFGLAKLLNRAAGDPTLTRQGQVMGTLNYMAPEQIETPNDVDHRADIYALGVVFYEMLTGELPLGKFSPPSERVQVDVRLDRVVLRALEKQPDRRYQQAGEVRTEVEDLAPSSVSHPAMAVTPPAEPRRCRMAVLGILGVPIALLLLGVTAGIAADWSGNLRWGTWGLGWFAAALVGIAGVALSISAWVRIRKSRGALTGLWLAVLGTFLPLALSPFAIIGGVLLEDATRPEPRTIPNPFEPPARADRIVQGGPTQRTDIKEQLLREIETLYGLGVDHVVAGRGPESARDLYTPSDYARIEQIPDDEIRLLAQGLRLGLPLCRLDSLEENIVRIRTIYSVQLTPRGDVATVTVLGETRMITFQIAKVREGWRFLARPVHDLVNPYRNAPPSWLKNR
jgi:predicted Ser/Thr protein kinase